MQDTVSMRVFFCTYKESHCAVVEVLQGEMEFEMELIEMN